MRGLGLTHISVPVLVMDAIVIEHRIGLGSRALTVLKLIAHDQYRIKTPFEI